jgi:NADP-dependent 3-hydroxy acid dehydrogenase YdfG
MDTGAGRVAIVTGASKGMGRQFVERLSAAGWSVAAFARASPELDSLSNDDKRIVAIRCDVSSSVQVNEAVAQTVDRFGRIDLVVNNAAVFWPFMIEDASDADIESHVGTNVLGVMWLIRAVLPRLRESKGHIVSLSSESVRNPFPMLSVYAATKAAVETLSAGLRDELQADGIRVSVLRSGSVEGSRGSDGWSAETKQAFYRKIVATGHARMAGAGASPQSMAEALLAIVSLPRDVNADLIEVRSARAGVPVGAQAVPGEVALEAGPVGHR